MRISKRSKAFILVFFISLLFPWAVFPENFTKLTISNKQFFGRAADGQPGASLIQGEVNSLLTDVEISANKVINNTAKLTPSNLRNSLGLIANGGAVALHGAAVDYASNFDLFVIGASVGGVVNSGNVSLTDLIDNISGSDLPPFGFGLQATGMIGYNIGRHLKNKKLWFIDLSRLKTYANFFIFKLPNNLVENLASDTLNFGLHTQYVIIKPKPIFSLKMLHWGGLEFNTGFEYNHFDVSYKQSVSTSVSSSDMSGKWDATASLELDNKTVGIPIELSTNIQFLYAFTLYTGIAWDFRGGNASIASNVTGTILINDTANANSKLFSADSTVSINESKAAMLSVVRVFAGLQINISLVKLFIHANLTADHSYGANAGVRVVW